MSKLVPIPWCTQSTKAQSGVVSSERLVNCYLEVNPQNSKGPTTIYGDAGLVYWAWVGSDPIRGMVVFNEQLYAVCGESLYLVGSDATTTTIGDVLGTGPVAIICNNTQIGIATDAGWYVYDSVAGTVTLCDAGHYTSATYQDGYGILSLADSEQFFITDIDTATGFTTIDPTDDMPVDTYADQLVAVLSDHRELIAFGTQTIEHYYNSGDAAFPFSRTPGGFVETGCAAAGSVAKMSNRVFWLGNDGGVWSMSGYQPQKISTPGIERLIKSIEIQNTATAFAYRLQGHEHYVLNFDNLSLVYDITTGLWRERESYGGNRWVAGCYARVYGLDVVADTVEGGNLFTLDLDTNSENGGAMVRLMQSAPLHGSGRRMRMDELYIDCEMGGVPDADWTAAGYDDPQVMLQYSDDGGKTWSNERWASMGKVGEYTKRVRFSRLGSFYQRTIRLSIADPVPVAIVGAYARIEECEQ